MNDIINKFLLVGDKFMPEMHLNQPGFTYSACGPFTKHAERIKKFKRRVIRRIFLKMSWIKHVLNMIVRIQITKICLIGHMKLRVIVNMMVIREVWQVWCTSLLIRKAVGVVLGM